MSLVVIAIFPLQEKLLWALRKTCNLQFQRFPGFDTQKTKVKQLGLKAEI